MSSSMTQQTGNYPLENHQRKYEVTSECSHTADLAIENTKQPNNRKLTETRRTRIKGLPFA